MYGRMLRVITRSSFLMALSLVVIFHGPAEARSRKASSPPPPQASIIIDAESGEVVHSRNADTITHPASLTKMMTLYMLFDQISAGRMRMDQRMAVSEHASAQAPSKLGLQPGQTIRVEDAILALVTKSANDVAVVVAEAIGGSESAFGVLMTQRARGLGMRSTVFRNASGLPDPDQITTARDMATLGRSLWRNHPRFYHYFSTREFDWNGDTITTHNRLMLRYNGADGIKTGYIRASGFNLVSSAERDGRRLIGAVMGGRSAASRDRRMEALLDAAFDSREAPDDDEVEVAAAPPAKAERSAAKDHKPIKFTNPERETAMVLRLPERKPEAGKPAPGKWGVQLGAYSGEAAARNAAEAASKRHASLLGDGRIVVSSSKQGKKAVYRARVMGISEVQARTACRKLNSDPGCLVLQPGTS